MSDKAKSLPKFGEWDVNDPTSAEGFTEIFKKASDERKTGGNSGGAETPEKENQSFKRVPHNSKLSVKKWFCCIRSRTARS